MRFVVVIRTHARTCRNVDEQTRIKRCRLPLAVGLIGVVREVEGNSAARDERGTRISCLDQINCCCCVFRSLSSCSCLVLRHTLRSCRHREHEILDYCRLNNRSGVTYGRFMISLFSGAIVKPISGLKRAEHIASERECGDGVVLVEVAWCALELGTHTMPHKKLRIAISIKCPLFQHVRSAGEHKDVMTYIWPRPERRDE